MGLTMSAFYGGAPPGAVPIPSQLNLGPDPLTGEGNISPALFWVLIVVVLALARYLYESGAEIID